MKPWVCATSLFAIVVLSSCHGMVKHQPRTVFEQVKEIDRSSFYWPRQADFHRKWQDYPIKKEILAVTGDFNGDGEPDTLKEYFFNYSTKKRITWMPADAGQGWLMEHDATTWLTSGSEKITPLSLGDLHFGILSLINLGDINGDALEELAIVTQSSGMSGNNHCGIYHYCNGVWKEIYWFNVHNGAYWYPDDLDPAIFETSIPGYLEKKDGAWFYYNSGLSWEESDKFMDSEGRAILAPLAPDIKKKCCCSKKQQGQ